MNAVKLLAIATVSVIVTLLCIRSGQAMAKGLMPAGAVHRPTDGTQKANGKLLAITIASTMKPTANNTSGAFSITESTITVLPNASETTSIAPTASKFTGELNGPTTNETRDAEKRDRMPKNASSRVLVDGKGHEDRLSRSKSPPVVVHGKLIKALTYPTDRYGENSVVVAVDDDGDKEDDDDDNTESNDANVVVDAEVYHANRPYYRQMMHNDYSTIDTDISVAQEDGSAGYHNSYDLTYNQNADSGWSGGSLPPAHTGGMGRPPYGSATATYPYPSGVGYKQYSMPRPPAMINHNMMNYQMHNPNSQVERFNIYSTLQQIQMISDKIDWNKVGVLAFFKIGLAKLKAFGFLKILFLLVFKLKMFLIAMFFKFLLILKLMKFFKLLLVPLILLSLTPILSAIASPMLVGGLLSIPSRIIEFLTGPVYVPASTAATKYSATDPTILPSTASIAKTADSLTPTLFKFDDLNVLDRRRLNMLELVDPSMNLFRKMLDTEKCVERIACRMAVVEKAGIFPAWINWVLHRVSKFVPNEKLESYLKTYDVVKDAISSKPETAVNWATWCLERYACNGINKTNVVGTKQ